MTSTSYLQYWNFTVIYCSSETHILMQYLYKCTLKSTLTMLVSFSWLKHNTYEISHQNCSRCKHQRLNEQSWIWTKISVFAWKTSHCKIIHFSISVGWKMSVYLKIENSNEGIPPPFYILCRRWFGS